MLLLLLVMMMMMMVEQVGSVMTSSDENCTDHLLK